MQARRRRYGLAPIATTSSNLFDARKIISCVRELRDAGDVRNFLG